MRGCRGRRSGGRTTGWRLVAEWNGLGVGMGNLWRLANAESRSISPENPTGGKGRGGMATEGTGAWPARELGQGWKVSPSVIVESGAEHVLADIHGSGAIQHIWLTPTGSWRNQVLRMWWDDDPQPAVECPLGDFFGLGWGEYAPLSSLAVCVNPGSAFNCYWEMRSGPTPGSPSPTSRPRSTGDGEFPTICGTGTEDYFC